MIYYSVYPIHYQLSVNFKSTKIYKQKPEK